MGGGDENIIHGNAILVLIDDPVFPYSGGSVLKQLGKIIHLPAAGGYHFNDPVRGTGAAFVCKLTMVADNAYKIAAAVMAL